MDYVAAGVRAREMRTLHAGNPDEVASASSIEVVLSDPAIRMVICSGIAIPEFRVNDDDKVYNAEVLVKLGVNAAALVTAVSHIGLASISNDDTAFTFATDSGKVELEPGTGELQLRVQMALRGEDTHLHRFGYQVVAHVRKVWARIAGTITVPRDILDLSDMPAAQLPAQFAISAFQIIIDPPPPGGGGGFGTTTTKVFAWGQIEGMRSDDRNCYVDYAIDNSPFALPLIVAATPVGQFGGGAVSYRTAGPDPVLLTNIAPAIEDVDFAVARAPVIK